MGRTGRRGQWLEPGTRRRAGSPGKLGRAVEVKRAVLLEGKRVLQSPGHRRRSRTSPLRGFGGHPGGSSPPTPATSTSKGGGPVGGQVALAQIAGAGGLQA